MMLTTTVELWNANQHMTRSALYQVAIWNTAKTGNVMDNEYIYTVALLQPGTRVAMTGPRRAQVPADKILHEVTIRHNQDDSALELIFRALRELRQGFPELFEAPPPAAKDGQPTQIAKVRNVFQ